MKLNELSLKYKIILIFLDRPFNVALVRLEIQSVILGIRTSISFPVLFN